MWGFAQRCFMSSCGSEAGAVAPCVATGLISSNWFSRRRCTDAFVDSEKYELAEVIAKNLGSSRKAVGHFLCGDDRVAWCAGHMLELCEPADYDEKYGKWNKDHLPIVMVPWKYKPIPNRRKQLGVIRDLIKEAEEIVHAGDAEEEGQLLVDEILEYYKVKKPVRRVLINDYNDKLVQKAINNLQDNRKFL